MNPFSAEAIRQRQAAASVPTEDGADQIPGAAQIPTEPEAPPDTQNPFLRVNIEEQRRQQLRATLAAAANTNPDEAARAAELGRRTGMPGDVVALNLQRVELQDAVDRADEKLQTSPVLRQRMLERPLFAKEALDDIEALSGIETLFREGVWGARQVAAGVPSFSAGAYGVLETTLRALTPLAEPLAGTILPENPIRRLAEGVADIRRGQQQLAKTTAGPLPEDAGLVRRGVQSGFQSVGSQAPGLIASVVTGNPAYALSAAGISAGGSEAVEAVEAGMDPAGAIIYGLSQASIEVATEMIPVSRLLGDIGAGTGLLKTLGRQAVAEIPGEQVATILQDLNEWAALNPDKPFSAYLAERPSAAAQTLIATLVGTSVQTTATYALAEATDRLGAANQKAREAEQSAQGVQRFFEAVANTKLAKRDPEALRETVQDVADANGTPEVFIDAQAFQQALQQSGQAAQILERMPTVAEQLREAVATGGDLVVPMGELSSLAGTQMAQEVIPLVRRDADAMTLAEAQQLGEQAQGLRTAAEQALAAAEDQAAAQASAAVVRDNILGQLNQARRFTPDVNTAYADFVRDFYVTQAQRLGVTAEELYQRYPLRIVAESPAQAGQVLEQAPIPEGIEIRELPDGDGFEALENGKRVGYLKDNLKRGQAEQIGESASIDIVKVDADRKGQGIGRALYEAFNEKHGGRIAPSGKTTRDAWAVWKRNFPAKVAEFVQQEAQRIRDGASPSLVIGNITDPEIAQQVSAAAGQLAQSAVDQTQTEEFKRWFGNSKVVDADGKPLVVYHGTTESFDRFAEDMMGEGSGTDWGAGFYFTDSTEAANQYADRSGGNVMPVYLRISNPAPRTVVESVLDQPGAEMDVDYVRDTLTEMGYDGIVIVHKDGAREFVVFRPEQIKSATGNRGTFDPNDPNILNQQTGADRGLFDPGSNTIALLKDADLSSFLHETGHFYLEVLADLASQPGAPQQVQADMRSLLDWFGFGGTVEQWRAQSLDARRDAHEQFARGFEAYLFEGKAPNPEVHTLFQRFRTWLKAIYKTIQSLNVQLTDEVRGVMSRMIATDEQIQAAEAAAGYMPLFETAEAAGMTPEQFIAYQQQAQEATAEATETLERRSLRDLKWFEGAKSRELKRLQKQAAAQRKTVRDEVTAEVDGMPVIQARAFLKGKKPTEIELEAIAEQFGFSSADHMRTDMAESPSRRDLIQAITDQRMLERHGDMVDQQAMERAALEAVHNEARAKLVAAEMKALQDMTEPKVQVGTDRRGRPVSVNALARAARQFAAESIARKKIRDIRPGQYTIAENKAGRQAQDALQRGDTPAAAVAKRNQLVNHYGATTAAAALAEVDQGVAYLARFNRDIKSIDTEYLDQIHQMLEQFDLRRGQSLRAIDRRKSFAEWLEDQRAQGFDPIVDEALIAEAGRVHYRDLTMEAFRGLVDTVRNIEHLGRLKKKLLLAKDQREFEAVEADIEALIRDNAKAVRPVELEGQRGIRPWLEGFAAGHRKVSSLMRQMSGGKDGGPLWEAFVRPMNERATFEAVENEKATMRLAELYKPVMALKGGLTGDSRFIPEINASLTRGGRLAVALNQGNETNRRRVMEGDGWNERQVQAILNTLTREEWAFVQGVWDFIDSYWPQIAEKEKRVTGVVPEKVEAEPFSVTLRDGATINLRGGYYPIKYDAARSTRAEQQEGAELAKDMLRGAFTRATTRRGHTKARTESVNRPIRKDLNVITEHVAQVVHDIAWHEWLIDANRLIGSEKIGQAIRETRGPEVLRTIKDAIQSIATADIVPQTKMDTLLLYLRSNVSRSTMGISLTTALLQPFGLSQSMVRIGTRHVLRGAARWAGDTVRFENSMAWIGEKSDFMRLRAKTFNRELHEIKGRVSKGQSQVRQIIDASMFMLMQKMQLVADVPTWIGQYEKALAEGRDEKTAVAMADQAVLDAQGGGQTKDLAEFQRKHPMLTMFYSYFSTTYNLVAESTARTDFKNPMAVAGWLSDMALLLVIPSILPNLVIAMLQGWESDEPEEWAKKLFEWQISFLMATVVGVREFSGLVSGFDYTGPPAARVVADAGKLSTQIQQGDMDEPLAMATIRFFGTLFGIPTTQLTRSYRGWAAWEEGDAPPTSILFGPPPRD
jgi:GNAT superfamily N-acetyltransferase